MEAHGLKALSSLLKAEPAKSRTQGGFSLVELLIAAAILSIGLLGLMALQVASTSQGSSSRERGTAVLLAHNLLDRAAAEGALSAGERMDSSTGTVTSTGFTFINPTTAGMGSAHTSTAAENLFFDIRGGSVATTAPTKIFTVSWHRDVGLLAGPNNALAQFTVNVQWQEAVQSGSATVIQNKYFSAARNVRI